MWYLGIWKIGTLLSLYLLFTSVWSLEIEDLDPMNRFNKYSAVHNKDICIPVWFCFVIVVSANLRFPWAIMVHVAVVGYVDLILWFRCWIDSHKYLCYYGKPCNCKYHSLSILPVGSRTVYSMSFFKKKSYSFYLRNVCLYIQLICLKI